MFGLGLRQHNSSQGIWVSSTNSRTPATGKKKVATIKKFSAGSDLAVVAKAIFPGCPGRVKYQATWWPAQCECGAALNPGDEVRVVGISNITLLVEPALSAVIAA